MQRIASSRMKLLYIASLLILAVIIVFTVFRPLAAGEKYTEVSKQSLFKTDGEWILQFDIQNHEGRDVKYTIHLLVSGQDYRESFVVGDGRKFTYIHHIKENNTGDGKVTYMIYREDEGKPLEQAIYYLK